ncbi:MAG TPA: molybdopterin-dependent oxidoreductase, partial [Chloroflexota bacterium]|nr:molybdopterin-dependent oxidoreductase [Chloroflexota bacterium]
MEFQLNGQTRHYAGDPDLSLLTYLREHEGILSPKDGCAPQAACGCCVVQLNDKAVLGCATKMSRVAGGEVTTIEGLGDYRQRVYANSFVACGGVQCGFCIPGIVMQAHVLIGHNAEPSRDDVEKALTPHLCRCTGYKKIVDAVITAAAAIRHEEEVELPESDGRIGSRLPKYQASKLVLGQHHYVDDIQIPGMKHGALKFSDHPRARVVKIDTSAAEKMDGVMRVFMAVDFPGDRFVGLIKQDWPQMIAEGEITRYVGDVLALVVAESDAIAREAVGQIVVEYEILEPITDMHAAMQTDSPTVHGSDSNVLSRSVTHRGDLMVARANSAYVVRGNFQTQMIEHGFMEPECAIAYPASDGIEVLSQGQGVFEDRVQIAKLLGLPQEKVRVQIVPNGGGFGGKEDLSAQGHAALAAYWLQPPVKVRL